ncbi:MAG: fluoride efflux transporter CrcB [Acidaminococcaceae bacterium]|nr:fluoride efflux transporter CrcB [Acidaminococcaceae bacterium]
MEYLSIANGGAFGSLVRFLIGRRIAEKSSMFFPIGTLVINITGAFLLGVVSAIGFNKNMYTLLGAGFLGAYTTFSTFTYEGFNLFQNNDRLNAFVYISFSLILGVFLYAMGFAIVKSI